MMRNQKGVSLITLVITIIVVIILAAIALRGAVDAPAQGNFSGFAQEVASVQESMDVAVTVTEGKEIGRGNPRNEAQIFNFLARGGYEVISGDESGDELWLIASDAEEIPCTLIDKRYAAASLGDALPVRKVETYKGTGQQISYFVTPKGMVFCWPPYTYDDRSYVTDTITAKDASGDEISGTDATNPNKNATITLKFEKTGETVVISNSDTVISESTTTFKRDDGKDFLNDKTKPSVWYDDANSKTSPEGGVAHGITFNDYNNTDERS